MEISKDQGKHDLPTVAASPSRRRFLVAFVLLWLTQFMVYCLRKPVGVLKIQLEKSMGVSKAQLGLLDVR